MANPYLVQPVSIGGGLAGLGQSLMQAGQIKQQREKEQEIKDKQAAASAELESTIGELEVAMQNKDYDTINKISLRYPDRAKLATQALSDEDKRKRDNVVNVGFEFLRSPQNYEQILRDNPVFTESVGGYDEAVQRMQTEPDQVLNEVSALLAWEGGDQWKQFREYQKSQQEKPVDLQYKDGVVFNPRTGEVRESGIVKEEKMTPYQQAQVDLKKQEIELAKQKTKSLIDASPKLSVNMEKSIEAAVSDSVKSRNSANNMSALAQQFRDEKPTTGLFGSAANMFAKLTGSDTTLRDLKIRQNALVNSQVLKFLPPGPATDKDVDIVRQGAPTTMDNPEVVARWLDAMANVERYSADFNEFKSEWMSANGNPGQARKDGEILGMPVKKGESMGAAVKRYLKITQQESPSNTVNTAPQGALDALRNDPSLADQFKAKYGYLPEGY